jgi:hypothetical protein
VLQEGDHDVVGLLGGAARRHLDAAFQAWAAASRSTLQTQLHQSAEGLQAQVAAVKQDMHDFHTNQQHLMQHLRSSTAERATTLEAQLGSHVEKMQVIEQECNNTRCASA